MTTDSFFEGLDDAEDVPAPAVVETPAEPEVAAKPDDKPAEKPAEAAKPVEKAAEVVAETPVEKPPEAKAPEQPDPRKFVPVGAHIELRNQMKAMQAELESLKNPPKAKPEAPDFIADPKGYVDHKLQDALTQLETGTKAANQTAEQANAQAHEARFHMALNAAEQGFVSRQPDYYQALSHLRTIRESEIRLLNPEMTQQDLTQAIGREELQLAGMLMQSGRNPSEVAYNLARARGYAPKAPDVPKVEPKPASAEKVAELLPKVPEPVKLSPDLTLGSGTGSPMSGSDIEEDPFDAAFKEMFPRRRA